MLGFVVSMTADTPNKPRVGIPWRTTEEESRQQMDKLLFYFDAVRRGRGRAHFDLARALAAGTRETTADSRRFCASGKPRGRGPGALWSASPPQDRGVGYQPGSYGSGNPPAFRPGGETGLRNLLWLPNPECVFWRHAGSGCAV